MAKLSLVGRIRVSPLLAVRGWRYAIAVLLLIAASPVHAQTVLTVNTHWADGLKCACTIVVKQMNADGSTTQIFEGVTDTIGHMSGSVNLQAQGVYSLSISSNAYHIPLFSLPFSTGLVASLPLKSAVLNFVFSRPSVNGQPIACCSLPANYTPPALASGTGVQFGI